MPLNITTPSKITSKFQPNVSMNSSGVDRVEVTTVCDTPNIIAYDKRRLSSILFIDGTKIYYYVNISKERYDQHIYFTDIKTNTITKTNFCMYEGEAERCIQIDPNKKYIYAIYDASLREGEYSSSSVRKLYRWDLTNGTTTLMDSSEHYDFDINLNPSAYGDYADFIRLTGTYFYNSTTMYCRKCSDRDYESGDLCNIPVYKATSNNGSLPTFTEIAKIPCCGLYAKYYYYGYVNISVLSVDESQHLIRYILYPTSYNLEVPKRQLYYNEYNYVTKKYFVDESYHFGSEIYIRDSHALNTNIYNGRMQYFVSNKRKAILPVYEGNGFLSVQQIQPVSSSDNYDGSRYPFGSNGINTSYYEVFNYELNSSFIENTSTAKMFDDMYGGAIFAADYPNGFFTLYDTKVIYVSINETEEK